MAMHGLANPKSLDRFLRNFTVGSFNKNFHLSPTYFAKNAKTNKQANGTSAGDPPRCVDAPSRK
jgi:hypothetical protein